MNCVLEVESVEQASATWNYPHLWYDCKGELPWTFEFNDSICPSIWCDLMHGFFRIPDDLHVSGIIAAVVVVALVVSVCGLGVCYAQRKGYFSSKWISPFFARQLSVDIECSHEILFLLRCPNKLWRIFFIDIPAVEHVPDGM